MGGGGYYFWLGASADADPALVASDQAPAGLAPRGFDPLRSFLQRNGNPLSVANELHLIGRNLCRHGSIWMGSAVEEGAIIIQKLMNHLADLPVTERPK